MTGHQAAYDLTDRVAVVTGAASGIGAASARLLADAGAYVICADRDRDGAERTVKDLDGRGEVLVLDVSDEQAVDAAATAVVEQHGRLDIWCNVAGIIETRPIAEMDDAAFKRIFDVNFLGTLHGCRSALRVMTAGDRAGRRQHHQPRPRPPSTPRPPASLRTRSARRPSHSSPRPWRSRQDRPTSG